MIQPNTFAKFAYILEADTTLTDNASVPVTYLNAKKWYDFKIKANKSKLKHTENIYFSLKLEFLKKELDEIDWILWDKWALNNTRPRAIEIEPQANVSIIYDKHECNLVGLVANRIESLNLKLRFNCASSQFAYSTENVADLNLRNTSTTFRLVIESFSDESGSKLDSLTCLIKLFEDDNAHRQFQLDQYYLVRNYVEILNPSRTSQNIMNKTNEITESIAKKECNSLPLQRSNNSKSPLADRNVTINIFYLYYNDKNYTSMPFPLTFNVSLTVDILKEKLFLPLVQKNVGNNYLQIENIYFRELKDAFDRHSSITLTDLSIPKVFKQNCGYKLELIETKRNHHRGGKHHQTTKPKIFHEITNNQTGNNLKKYVAKNVNSLCQNLEHLVHEKSNSKRQYYNLYIIECFIV